MLLRHRSTCFALFLAMCLGVGMRALADDGYLARPDVQAFIDDVSSRNALDRHWIESVIASARPRDSIIATMSRPAEKTLTWDEYRALFLTDKRIQWGRDFLSEHHDTLVRAEADYGVPASIIAAIIGVETYYGRNVGNYRVLDALATLGFDYAPRSKFFRGELEQFLLMAHEQKLPATELKGSYAGAMGFGQFMPSSYRSYAVDFNGDGVVNLWAADDAIGSVARYFALHGWQTGQAVTLPIRATAAADSGVLASSPKPNFTVAEIQAAGFQVAPGLPPDLPAAVIELKNAGPSEYWLGLQNFYVITRYNHSPLYAMAVYQLSQALEKPL